MGKFLAKTKKVVRLRVQTHRMRRGSTLCGTSLHASVNLKNKTRRDMSGMSFLSVTKISLS